MDIKARMDKMSESIKPAITGGMDVLKDKEGTDLLRDDILAQMNEFIPDMPAQSPPDPPTQPPSPPAPQPPSTPHLLSLPSDPDALHCLEPQTVNSDNLRKVVDSIENEEDAGIYVVWREAYKPKVFEVPQSVGGYLDTTFCRDICSEGGNKGFRGCEPASEHVDEMFLNIILTTCSFADKGNKFKGGVYNEHMYMVANHAGAIPSFQRERDKVERFDKLAVGLAPFSDNCQSHFFSSTSPMILTLAEVLPDDVKVSVLLSLESTGA